MSNAMYDKAREAFLKGDIDWLNDNIKVVLVDTNDYTVNLAEHDFLDDIPVAARVSTSDNLTDKTATNGVADAGDVTLSSVVGDESEALVIYKDTGDPSTSQLIAYLDTVSGLPITPNGGDIIIEWDEGANKIFKL